GGRGGPAARLRPFQPVPDAADRGDEPRMRRVILDLAAQALDGDVHQPRVADVVVAPDPFQEQLPCEDLPRTPGQLEQQPELGRREAYVAAVLPGDEPGRVDLHVANS